MKRYHEYKSLQSASNAFARENGYGKATALTVAEIADVEMGERGPFGYRKCVTGEYVPKAYLANFGWKNTYYQHAVSVVRVPVDWYLWFGWRI